MNTTNRMNPPMNDPPPRELEYIANHIFSRPPDPPKTHVFALTEESAAEFQNDPNASPEQEIYIDIARLGIPILFGETCNFKQLTRDQFALLQNYMHSMGVALSVTCNADKTNPWDLVASGGKILYWNISITHI